MIPMGNEFFLWLTDSYLIIISYNIGAILLANIQKNEWD